MIIISLCLKRDVVAARWITVKKIVGTLYLSIDAMREIAMEKAVLYVCVKGSVLFIGKCNPLMLLLLPRS